MQTQRGLIEYEATKFSHYRLTRLAMFQFILEYLCMKSSAVASNSEADFPFISFNLRIYSCQFILI